MPKQTESKKKSAFDELGLAGTVKAIYSEIQELYLGDQVPWVVGYSGGKDSSAVLQLVWLALKQLPTEKRHKTVHVISTDTLVEQPLVAAWVDASHARMREAAAKDEMPVVPHKLSPQVQDTFWVNLIGKGYPAPRNKFRWCTERMKISPSNHFIRDVVRANGEAILVLGTRKAESSLRRRQMETNERHQVRERLRPNLGLNNSLVYSPIEDWTNDDVWLFLMQVRNPWGHDNKSLLTMYQGASADGECPLVVDTSTPSCGSSRFGCWVCTVVDKDRSMEAMIKNDDEKVWMTPLLSLRNELDEPDRDKRDFRRMGGHVQLMSNGNYIPGPYTKTWRENWLRRLLEVQEQVRSEGPPEFRELSLITNEELLEIRRIWLTEKHEFDDSLPAIYEQVTGRTLSVPEEDGAVLTSEDWKLLRQVCGEDEALFELQTALLDTERKYQGMSRRVGIHDALEDCFKRSLYENAETAVQVLQSRQSALYEEMNKIKAEQGLVPVPADRVAETPDIFGTGELTSDF